MLSLLSSITMRPQKRLKVRGSRHWGLISMSTFFWVCTYTACTQSRGPSLPWHPPQACTLVLQIWRQSAPVTWSPCRLPGGGKERRLYIEPQSGPSTD